MQFVEMGRDTGTVLCPTESGRDNGFTCRWDAEPSPVPEEHIYLSFYIGSLFIIKYFLLKYIWKIKGLETDSQAIMKVSFGTGDGHASQRKLDFITKSLVRWDT